MIKNLSLRNSNNGESKFVRNKADSTNRTRASIEQKEKAKPEPKKAAPPPEPKAKPPEPVRKRERTSSSLSDLMAPYNRGNGQSAAQRNLSKAKRFKDVLMELIHNLNTTHTFERTPYRCAVLRAHYNWTAGLMFLVFFYAISTYYGEEPIKCIDQSDRKKAPPEALDICIQFPFTMKNHQSRLDGERTYATFYMWAHWGCGLLLLLYKIVHVAVYLLENKSLKRLIDTLQKTLDYNYRTHLVKAYFQENYGNHRFTVLKVIILHVIALIVNTGTFFILDLFFGFRYRFFPRYLMIKRDFVFFDDEYSLLFPPFAECEIGPHLHIQMGRTNFYGCHLALMEFYEKIFMMLWFWQVFLAVWTILSMMEWCSYLFCKKIKLDAEEMYRCKDTRKKLKKVPLDEVVILNLVKGFLFGQHYRALISALLKWNPNVSQLDVPISEYEIKRPYILQGLSKMADEDVETFFEEIMQEIPVSLREEAFSPDTPPPMGWKLNIPMKAPVKPKPSAPSANDGSYYSNDKKEKDLYSSEKNRKSDKRDYGWNTTSDRSNDSGARTPSTVPAKEAYRSPTPDSSDNWDD